MANFNCLLAEKRQSTFYPARKGLRFSNFESKLAQFPKIDDSSPTNPNLRPTMGDFTIKHIVQKVCNWFEIWLPWQRRVLLCGITDRCSKQQLEYLATALEPAFHRDFSTSLSKEKVHGVSKKNQQEKDSLMALLKALQMATKGTQYEDDYLVLKSVRKSPSCNNLEEFVHKYVKQVINDAFDTIRGRTTKTPATTDQLTPQDPQTSLPVTTTQFVPRFRTHSEDTNLRSEDTSQLIPTITTDSDQLADRITKSTEFTPPSRNLGPYHRSPKSHPDDRPRHGRHWTFPGCQNLQTPLFSSNLEGQVATDSGTMFTPGYGTGSYVPLQTNIVSTLTWCMKHQMRDMSPTSPASSGGSRLASHHHNSQVSACSASTQDFFQPAQHTHKLGKMYRALRTGQIRKPDRVTDVSIPLQKSFKNAKWWGRAPSSGRQLVPAHHAELQEHFKKQIIQIWEWIQDWEDSDTGDLLVELIKMCDQDLVKFMAQCLQQRLRDRNDINCLPDKLLLHIFTFLPPRDIAISEQVCHRWRYIAAHDVLWKLKCQEMGEKEGVINLPGLIEEFNDGCSVDWRSAYTELCQVALNAKIPPTPETQVGETGTKKWLSIKFSELIKKRMHSPESVKLSPIKSESLSSEESSTVQQIMDVPLHFLQTVVPVKETEEDGIEELTMSEFAMQGIAPDFNLFPELTLADISAVVPGALPADLQLPFPGKTKDKDVLEDKARQEGVEVEAGKEADDKKLKTKKRKEKKKKTKSRDDDIALDIRPELAQAKDILGDLQVDVSASTKPLKHPGWVKPVKRVRRLQGHTDAVCCLMFDKCRIFTGSMDRTIRVWDIRSGRSIHKIYGHKGGIRCLQFDDTRIVSGSWDMTVMVWDIVKFDNLATLTGHLDVVSCLQFDKRHLVTGSHDKTIRVWSMDGYHCVRVLRHHRDSVTCLVFDGSFVTSGSADRTIQVTRISTGECILKLTDYLDAVTSLDVQGELIVGGTMSGKLFFWNKLSGQVVAGVQPHDSTVSKIVFLPRGGRGGGRFITAAGDGSIKEWDLYSMTCVRALHGHQGTVRDVKVSGDRIVSCSDDGNVRIWDLLTPPLRLGDKGEDDTIETKTIDQRKEAYILTAELWNAIRLVEILRIYRMQDGNIFSPKCRLPMIRKTTSKKNINIID